jgi:hypothetical protein
MKASTFAIFLTFAVILAAASAQEEAQEVSDIENEFLGELDTDTDPDTTDVEENQKWGSRLRRRRAPLPAVDGKKGSLGAYGCKVSGKFLGDHMQYGGRCNNRCPGWVCGHCRTINSDQSGTCKNSGNCAGIGSCCNDIFNKARGCLSAKTAGACSAAGARAKFGNTHGCTWVAPPIPRKTNCLRYAYQNGHYRQRFHEGCSTFRGSKSSCHAHCNKASNSASRAACRNGCDWMTCDGAGFGNHKYGCNTASPRYKSCGGNIWCSPEVASGEMEEDADVSDVEEEQSLSRWPYVVRSGRDCIGGAFKCGHGSLHTAYRACEASRHCGAVAFRGNHYCLKHPVRHCRQDYRNGYKMYKKPHCPNYRMMAPRRVDCKHGAYKCGASYSECDAKRKCAGDRRCGGVSVSPNGKHYCLKHKKRHCSKDYGNKYTFFTK